MLRKSLMGVVASIAISSSAWAAPQQCNQRDEVLKLLSNKYSESPVAFGVTNNGGLVEVLRSAPSAKDDT